VAAPCARKTIQIVILFAAVHTAQGADWPMWRLDAGRTAESPEILPAELHLRWARDLGALKPAFANPRLQFDRSHEPVVLGERLFVGSSRNDCLLALDTDSGRELWRFYAAGPIRVAPVAWSDRVCFGADDGNLYCLNAADGTLRWQFRAAPSARKILGNGRMVSVWPVRGGPVLHQNRIYFAAGVWPSEGVFVYAVDAETGQQIWRNDRGSFLFGVHPHGATAIGGITPQGYLLVHGNELVVPCGTAYPATFDLATGQLKSFQLPEPGRLPGGWFAALTKAQRRGESPVPPWQLTFDKQVNSDRHEDDWRTGRGTEDVRTRIRAGGRTYDFTQKLPGIDGQITSLAAADGKLFVADSHGVLSCLGEKPERVIQQRTSTPVPRRLDETPHPFLQRIGALHGYALILGAGSDGLLEELVHSTPLQVIVRDSDPKLTQATRERLDQAGWYGTRITVLEATTELVDLPSYFASLVVVREFDARHVESVRAQLAELYRCLRPHGGTAVLWPSADQLAAVNGLFQSLRLEGAQHSVQDGTIQLTRAGSLPGAANYTTPFQLSTDENVRAPLSILWYDDEVGFFKRSPPPMFVDGVMRAFDELWTGYPQGERPPYKLGASTFMDVFTGRRLDDAEITRVNSQFPAVDTTQLPPNQFRPPTQRDEWKPDPPVPGQRVNPLTGAHEPRTFPKSYGCDGGFDYGYLYTMRSGTAAFYDKRAESGTVHISGPRSGCTNSIIPACGLLNVPYYFKGCTCSYPLPTSLAMVSAPDTFEQWSTWGSPGNDPVQQIRRVGINFGAPGDRITDAGTLWLDYPAVGGPSPTVQVALEPQEVKYFYQHSQFLRGGRGWPWVAASGVEGLSKLKIDGLTAGRYCVRLYFAEPRAAEPGSRVFDVWVQGRLELPRFDVVNAAQGSLRSAVHEMTDVLSEGTLEVQFVAHAGQPLISGVEIVATGLPLDELP